jgi:hypothetical protein
VKIIGKIHGVLCVRVQRRTAYRTNIDGICHCVLRLNVPNKQAKCKYKRKFYQFHNVAYFLLKN